MKYGVQNIASSFYQNKKRLPESHNSISIEWMAFFDVFMTYMLLLMYIIHLYFQSCLN